MAGMTLRCNVRESTGQQAHRQAGASTSYPTKSLRGHAKRRHTARAPHVAPSQIAAGTLLAYCPLSASRFLRAASTFARALSTAESVRTAARSVA